MDTNALRPRLQRPPPLVGIFSILGSMEVVEMVGLAGFDFVIVDLEHGPMGIQAVPPLILAARARKLLPLVRVRSADPALIGSALDAGAAGVIVPQVCDAQTARAVVDAARFAPDGRRGLNPWVRAADFAADAGWLARTNAEVAVLAMVEGREGLDALPQILDVQGLDAIFLGPVDLAQSLGVGLQPEHPAVIEAVTKAVADAAAKDKRVAVFAPTAAAAQRWLDRGVAMVAVSEDTAILGSALKDLRAAIRPVTGS